MDFIRRIGTIRHKFKLQFFINKITFNKHLPGNIYVSIRRGDHKRNTQNIVELNKEHVASFGNQIVTFQSITLFYDQSEKQYQEKMGQMKIIMKTSGGDKKLLGVVPFDVAEYANLKKQNTKVKKTIQETPAKLEGEIYFQVYVKFIGEASETDKSVKSQKKRGDSPFDKISNFLFGGNEEEEKNQEQKNQKKVALSPKKSQLAAKPSKVKGDKNRQRTNAEQKQVVSKKKVQIPQFEEVEEEVKQFKKQQSRKSTDNKPNKQKQSNHGKTKERKQRKSIQQPKQQQELFNNYQPQPPKQQKTKKHNKTKKPTIDPVEQQLQFSQVQNVPISNSKPTSKINNSNKKQLIQQPSKITGSKKKDSSYQSQKNMDFDRNSKDKTSSKASKNLIMAKQRDNLTEYEQVSNKRSNFNGSQAPPYKNNQQTTSPFFFEDPNNFPAVLPPQPKRTTKSKQPTVEQTQQELQSDSRLSNIGKISKNIKQDDGLKLSNSQIQQSVVDNKQSKQSSPNIHMKKIKQNTIAINMEVQSNKSIKQGNKSTNKPKEQQRAGLALNDASIKNIFGNANQKEKEQTNTSLSKQDEGLKSKKESLHSFKAKEQRKPIIDPKQSLDHYDTDQIQNMFDSFDQNDATVNGKAQTSDKPSLKDRQKVDQMPIPKAKQQISANAIDKDKYQIEIRKLKAEIISQQGELKKKQLIITSINQKKNQQQDLAIRLKQSERIRQEMDNNIKDSTTQKLKLQLQIKRLKEEVTALKSQANNVPSKDQSFFRMTQGKYQQPLEEEQNLQQEVKRLQREKNEQMIINQQQRQKFRKQMKKVNEALQEKKIKYKELEDTSKAELKKLKDQIVKLNTAAQVLKGDNGDKQKQNSLLVEQNKKANQSIIELKQKLAGIKIKICQKLNEANQSGQAELMQVLTDLSEDI